MRLLGLQFGASLRHGEQLGNHQRGRLDALLWRCEERLRGLPLPVPFDVEELSRDTGASGPELVGPRGHGGADALLRELPSRPTGVAAQQLAGVFGEVGLRDRELA